MLDNSVSSINETAIDKESKTKFIEIFFGEFDFVCHDTGKLTYRDPSVTKHAEIQDNLEVSLLSISIVAEVSSLTLLMAVRHVRM